MQGVVTPWAESYTFSSSIQESFIIVWGVLHILDGFFAGRLCTYFPLFLHTDSAGYLHVTETRFV